MGVVSSMKPRVFVLEKDITLAATSGTTVGIAIPADTLVLSAGFETYEAVEDVTTYTLDIGNGSLNVGTGLSIDAAAAGKTVVGVTPQLYEAADTIDVTTTISGSPTTVAGRLFVVCVDVSDQNAGGAIADRDQLA